MLYEFTKLQLEKDEFYNLVFMNASCKWKKHLCEDNVLRQICTKPLHCVVKKVIEKSGLTGDNLRPTEIFEKIKEKAPGEGEPWFKRFARLSEEFDKSKMLPISIRNLRKCGKEQCNKASQFYIEDGCCRSLVYALKLELEERCEYEPVEAIHATSWALANRVLDFIPQWDFVPQKAAELVNEGKFPDDKTEASLVNEGKLPDNKKPTEFQIKTYKR